jgi:protein SCO1/2
MSARLVMALAAIAAAAVHAQPGPHPEAGVGFEQRPGAALPMQAPFVDARGSATTLARALDGRPAVLVLGYARCPELCGTVVPGVAEALDRAGLSPATDYRAIFASLDARETPASLAEMALRVPARDRDGWRFLGGNEASVREVARAAGFDYRYEPERDAFAHPAGLVVLTPQGTVARYLFGVRFDPSDLRLALVQARAGRTGGLADRLLLLCYHYDPVTGRYSAAILDALRLLAVACAMAAAALAWRWRRGKGPA